jgi:hypothetical protein
MNTGTWDSFYIEDSSTTYLDGVSFPNGLVVSFTVLPSLGGLLIPPEQTMFLDQRADFSSLDVSLVSSPPQILYQLDTYYLTRSSDTGPSIVDITSVDSASDAPQTDGSSNVTAGDTPQKESASQNSGSQTINSTTRSRASGADTTKPATPPSSSSRPTDAGSDPSGKSLGGGAIAGIAIGGILVLILIIGGWFFWRRWDMIRKMAKTGWSAQVLRHQRPAVIKHTTKRCLVFPLGKIWSLRTQTSIRYQGLMN